MKLNLQFFATKVMRYDIADYLGVTVGETTTYYLLGVGVTKLDESPSPKTNTDAYITSRAGQTVLTGYDNSFPIDAQHIPSEAAIAALHAVARNQLIGDDAEFTLVRADLYDRVGSTGTVYNARKFAVTFVPGDMSGENTDVMKLTGSLNQNGDLVQGTFDTTAKTFTEGAEETRYAVTMTVDPVTAGVILVDSDGANIPVTVNGVTGVVTIPVLPAGTYGYTVYADDYITQVDTFEVVDAPVAVGTITLVSGI
jgi:hypothetical protein